MTGPEVKIASILERESKSPTFGGRIKVGTESKRVTPFCKN